MITENSPSLKERKITFVLLLIVWVVYVWGVTWVSLAWYESIYAMVPFTWRLILIGIMLVGWIFVYRISLPAMYKLLNSAWYGRKFV